MYFKFFKKIISIITIAIFITTNTIYAAPDSKSIFKNKKVDYQKISDKNDEVMRQKKAITNGEDTKQIESQEKEAKKILSSHLEDISQIHIPQELGRITEAYNNASSADKKPNLIVHIQDLHTNPEAELNLAKILEILLKDYNMALVCSEGADGKVDTSSISNFPDSQAKEKVSRIFIDSGELTGEEYLSITKYPELPIWGIETRDIYFKNIIDFNNIMKFIPDSQVFISQVKKVIEEIKPRVYSKDLLDLDQQGSEFNSQKLDTAKYMQYLDSFTKKFSIPMSNYKNISLLTDTMGTEKTIDQLKIMNQSQNLLLNLQSTLQSRSLNTDLDGLIARSNLSKDQKISQFSFYSYLKDLANKHMKEDFSVKYPELNNFIDYLIKVNSLDSTKLFTELEDLSFEIKEALSKTDEQKTLVKASRSINFLENFFNLKVSNEDLDYYLNNRDSHKVAFFKDFLPKTIKKYNINTFIDYNPALIDSHLQELEDFYKVVKERDIAMVTNSLSEIEKRNAKVSTLIAGGFHTKGITKLLKEKGYSYIVVSPYSKTDIDEENYHFLLSGKRKPIADLIKKYLNLPEIVNRLAPFTLRVPLAYSETAVAFAQQIAGEVGGDRTAADLAGNMASLLGLSNHADVWAGFGNRGIIGLSPAPGIVVVPWGHTYLEFTASGITAVSVGRYTGNTVVNIPAYGAQVARLAGVEIIGISTYSFLNNRLQGMGIIVDQDGQLAYSAGAKARGLDRDYEQAGKRTVGDLRKKGVVGKLAQKQTEFLAIQGKVLYNMIHGLVPTPRQKLNKTADGNLKGWSTLNFTQFNPDLAEFPDGEIVKTAGRFNLQLGIQQVGQGEFISLQIKYDAAGNPVETRAQYLKPGDIFYALPGYFHVTIPVGAGPHSFFDIGYADGTYKEVNYDWPNNTPAPYLFVNQSGKIAVVLNPDYKNKEIPPIQWYTADKLPEAEGQVSLIDIYAKADEPGISRILNAIEAGSLEAGTQVALPSQVEMTFFAENLSWLRGVRDEAIDAFKANPMLLQIHCVVQHYDWGDTEFIPALLEIDNSAKTPYAELWIGAHPNAPAKANIKRIEVNLNDLINGAAEEMLGKDIAAQFNKQLPYLLKILAAGKMLSIQAHPDKTQAQAGFEKENAIGISVKAPNRNYKDANHKPELIVAVTDFYALNGFRPLEEIAGLLEDIEEFREIMPDFRQRLDAADQNGVMRKELIKELYSKIMSEEFMPQKRVDEILKPLIERLKKLSFSENDREFWILKADEQYTKNSHIDRGIFSIYLLNLINLKPGEAMYLGAGELHAYLEGVGMESMANSDNVLRGGLTPKYVDASELLKVLTFNSGKPDILKSREISETEALYDTPAEEFMLSIIEVASEKAHKNIKLHSADALIVMEGEVEIRTKEQTIKLKKGETAIIPAILGEYEITGQGKLYKASVPLGNATIAEKVWSRNAATSSL